MKEHDSSREHCCCAGMSVSRPDVALEAATKRHKTAPRRPADGGTKWQEQHKKIRKKLGLPDTALIHEERSQDLVTIAEQATKQKYATMGCDEVSRRLQELYTDTSQSAGRMPWACSMLRSITSSTDVWYHAEARRLRPDELFRILGFSDPKLSTLSQTQARDLLGSCMSMPVIGMITASLLISVCLVPEA